MTSTSDYEMGRIAAGLLLGRLSGPALMDAVVGAGFEVIERESL